MGVTPKEIDRVEVLKLITRLRKVHAPEKLDADSKNSAIDDIVFFQYSNSSNGFLAQVYEAVFGERVKITGSYYKSALSS